MKKQRLQCLPAFAGLAILLSVAVLQTVNQGKPLAGSGFVQAGFGFGVNDLLQPLENWLNALETKFISAAEAIAQKWLQPLDSTVAKYQMTMNQLQHWGPFGATQSAMSVFNQFSAVQVDPSIGTSFSIGGMPRATGTTTYQATGSIQAPGWTPGGFTIPVYGGSGGNWPTPTPPPGASPSPTPSPTPPPTPTGTIVEAESSTDFINFFLEYPQVTPSACSGAYMRQIANNQTAMIRWVIQIPSGQSGSYDVSLHYAGLGPGTHGASLVVDGVWLSSILCPPTGQSGGAYNWAFSTSSVVDFASSGTHVVELDFDAGDDASPYLDYMLLTPDSSSSQSFTAHRVATFTRKPSYGGTVQPGQANYRGLSAHFLGFDRNGSAVGSVGSATGVKARFMDDGGSGGLSSPVDVGSGSGMLKLDFAPYDSGSGTGSFLGNVRTFIRLLEGGLVWAALLFWIVKTLTVKFSS